VCALQRPSGFLRLRAGVVWVRRAGHIDKALLTWSWPGKATPFSLSRGQNKDKTSAKEQTLLTHTHAHEV